ncbi:acetyl-CoA carboxylase biotin carboxylase subunit [Silvibacterium dinghuense]|uniref:Acetyl-CoA carboxylase biotin carboxylase subunit n=1 Tax=Silvibacterium dinghuense TaxID=1560006 RepID=A0A4Q1SKE1_9BACT|nr:acetyl-CoA carboxylase biotin carboxylase subunit [Silvibacterium dinghuense]RXS97929.1 acetyl-CoA carboxylase biotin carboxylase subunit [Silvibacterium dinghuense]GGH03079.1 biotin carboxylase [Silvibacterium dinghuense]
MFRKVLIANRGEIALRLIRACDELGVSTVAVYSDADRAALHVSAAKEACWLGPAPARESYLRGDRILEIAKQTGAEAIHPGYGFLSENADFAAACEHAGIKFIGPPSAAMRELGSKTSARRAADRAGMPRTPGSTRGLASLDEAYAVAQEIGYPVMLKAAAGGGGKGMRAVTHRDELRAAFEAAQSEAERAFGSSEVYLEKLIERPRHIEIQILADEHGKCLYLGERECSVQRRHQKVIEEAPSSVVSEDLRRRMGEAAVRLAQSAGYTNAGTVEFLLDNEENFYFLEMNTRLQVEHPVTELVTGLDLVHLQLRIAAGEPLPFTQEEVQLRGHAIECRIYAEDPDNGFFPSPGRITRLLRPGGPGIREDCGVYEGWTVPMDYDPMLSKLIAYAPSREMAIVRMERALGEYVIGGIRTNLGFFRRILADPDFRTAHIDTGYLDRLLAENVTHQVINSAESEEIAGIAAALFERLRPAISPSGGEQAGVSPWKAAARQEGLRG